MHILCHKIAALETKKNVKCTKGVSGLTFRDVPSIKVVLSVPPLLPYILCYASVPVGSHRLYIHFFTLKIFPTSFKTFKLHGIRAGDLGRLKSKVIYI